MSNSSSIFFLLNIFLLSLISSCISSSKIRYLQEDKKTGEVRFVIEPVEYHIQKGDNLYINLSSTEPVTNQVLAPEVNVTSQQGLRTKYKDVYLVDNKGCVDLAQIGKFYLDSFTIQQVKDSLYLKIKKYFTQVNVDVRLADNYITIIGEVNKPGRYLIDFRDKLSVFEAIGMAGDLTFEAKRNEVKLLRKIGNETILIKLDLTESNVLKSPYYYLLPNDIVMVDPLKAVNYGQKSIPVASTIALILSVTTSILVIISYLK